MPNKLRKKLKQTEFYCVACRKRVKVHPDDICVEVFKNKKIEGGVPALRSVCKCGVNLTKFIKHRDEYRMSNKYGDC